MSIPTATQTAPAAPWNPSANPFVGPQSIAVGEKIYGRDREVRELRSRLVADRLVLMYSPSGAGKTSLINAGLLPELEARGFAVLPTIRVNRPEAEGGERNRYMVSTVLSLRPDLDITALQSISLGECIDAALAEGDADLHPCLIFDQFEEVLTTDTDERGQELRREFLAELGVALRDKRFWALFSMREDYVTQLDPYLRLLPTQLQSHFRLELLTADQAEDAAIRIACREQPDGSVAGRTFHTEAATRLVHDLRTVTLDRGNGPEPVTGIHVEPVHLQVVCRRLWARLPADEREIGLGDVERLGDVDEALRGFYADQVRDVAAAAAGELTIVAKEREVRLWIEDALISDQALRRQSDGRWHGAAVDPEVLRLLGQGHLIRREERGASWYELAHDRLVRPVLDSNEEWRTNDLGTFQRSTDAWLIGGRHPDHLLRGKELKQAKKWSGEHKRELLVLDREFLEASAADEQSRASGRWARILAGLAVVLLLVVGGLAWRSILSERAATRAADTANAFGVARQSRGLHNSNAALALAVAAESTAITGEPSPTSLDALVGARTALRESFWQPVGERLVQHRARRAAISPDGTLIAAAGCPVPTTRCEADEALDITVRSVANPKDALITFAAHDSPVLDLAFTADGRRLASAASDDTVRFWDVATGDEIIELRAQHPVPASDLADFRINALAFDEDSSRLVSGDTSGRVWMWDLTTNPPTGRALNRGPFATPGRPDGVNDVTFRPDGKLIASAESNGEVILWDPSSGAAVKQLTYPRDDGDQVRPARRVAFAPEPETCPPSRRDLSCLDVLFAGHERGLLWHWENPNSETPLAVAMPGHTESIESLSFGPAGSGVLASSSGDRTIRMWSVERQPVVGVDDASLLTIEPIGSPLTEHSESVDKVGFSADGRLMVSSSRDGSVRLWAAPQDVGVTQLGEPLVCVDSPTRFATAVAFGPDDRFLVSTGIDGVLRLWNPQTGQLIRSIDAEASMFAVAVHPRDNVVIATGDGRIVGWDIDTDPTSLSVLWSDTDGDDGAVSARTVAFDEPTGYAATADDTGMIRLWDTSADDPTNAMLDEASTPTDARVDALAFGETDIYAGDTNGVVWMLSFDGGQLGDPVMASDDHEENVRGVALDSEHRLLATGSRDQSVLVADLQDPDRDPLRLLGHRNEVGAVAFTDTAAEDGAALLASASNDGTIRLWWLGFDAKNALVLAEDEPIPPSELCRAQPQCFTLGIAFSADGTMLASASSEGLVHVWHQLTDPTTACRLAEDFISHDQLDAALNTEKFEVCFQAG